MLTQQERDTLFERQSRLYELADVATKPAQWVLGGLKLLWLAVVVVAVLVGTPFYLLATHQTVSVADCLVAFNALAALVLFFLCPFYVVIGGPLYFCGTVMWLEAYHRDWANASWFTLRGWVFVWVAMGYVWYFVKRQLRRDRTSERPPSATPTTTTDIEIYPPAPEQELTDDSPIPPHLQRRLTANAESIITVLEAALAAERAASEANDIEDMSLMDALRSTNDLFNAIVPRMRELVRITRNPDCVTREQAVAFVQEFLGMQQIVCARADALIARLRREAPEHVAAFEATTNEIRCRMAELQRVAISKGLLQ